MKSSVFAHLVTPNGIHYRQPLGLFINNEFVEAKSGDTLTTIDPATESPITSVHSAGVEDVNDAVRAAHTAFHTTWSETPGTERGRLLSKLANLVEENAKNLASIESWDNGKPFYTAIEEDIPEVVSVLRYYAGWADKRFGQVIETQGTQLNYTIPEPVGVCGQIIPWNYPIVMASWKLGPALAAGNTVVLKASEQTPLSILFLAWLIGQAGFPPGVVNIINGPGDTAGAALASHQDVDKIAFTGSTQTGKAIMKLAASNLKAITLETGGKSPLIVFNDADLHAAVSAAYPGIMANAGQNCTANSRILVQEGVYRQFVELFKAQAVASSKLGDPFSRDTLQGPQITQAQFDQILSYIDSGHEEGASLIHGGKPFKNFNGKGFFIEPTIFTDVTPEMRIYREEIFGPFVVILPFRAEADAVEMANDTEYGLAAAVFTKDISRAHRITRKIKAGTVWINNSQLMDPRIPFGGVKQSGIGQELGEAGIKAYTTYKTVVVDLAPETHLSNGWDAADTLHRQKL